MKLQMDGQQPPDVSRTIRINLGQKERPHLRQAIGYLATWALPEFDVVSIFPDGNGQNLIAYYSNTETGRKYTIGAIWMADKQYYSFHS